MKNFQPSQHSAYNLLLVSGSKNDSGHIAADSSKLAKATAKIIGSIFTAMLFAAFMMPSMVTYGQLTTVPFTSSGTWTVPAGVTSINLYIWGGGGGAGGSVNSGQFANGGGGGGGACALKTISGLVPGDVYTLTVGAGGTAGSTSGGAGGAGGTTTFTGPAGTWTVSGGLGGAGSTGGGSVRAGGAAGTTGTGAGISIFAGGAGSAGNDGTSSTTGITGTGGGGGGSGGVGTTPISACGQTGTGGIGTFPGGNGGSNGSCGGTTNTAGTAGAVPGGGGGGANCWTGSNPGGAGGGGKIIIVYPVCAAPSAQPTILTSTSITTTSIQGSFTSSGADGYLVVAYAHGATPTAPVSPVTYAVNSFLGSGKIIGASNATTFTYSSLIPNTQYDFYVYAYTSNASCAGTTYLVTTPLTGTLSTAACGGISGIIPIGPGVPASPAGFPSLTAANTYIAANGLAGNTILELQSGYTSAYAAANETYPLTFASNVCINSASKLTVRPAAGISTPIIWTSAVALGTVYFNGGNYVTIDGRAGGTGSSSMLSIINTSSTSSAIMFINDAQHNTITYCDVQGQNTTNTSGSQCGVIYIATANATSLLGNDFNTISFSNIHATAGGTPAIGIYFNGSTTNTSSWNDMDSIISCNIYDFFNVAQQCTGIKCENGTNATVILNNHLYQTATRTFTTGQTMRGFWLTPSASTTAGSFIIVGNYIGGSAANGTGNLTIAGGTNSFWGMDINHLISIGQPHTSVQGNTITNISVTSTTITAADLFRGISTGSTGCVDIGTITGNIIGSATGTGLISLSTTGNSSISYGIKAASASTSNDTINIYNNIIGGISASSTTSTNAANLFGIGVTAGSYTNITGNTIGSTSTANSLNAPNPATTVQSVYGINVAAGLVTTITNNTIANLNNGYVSTSTGLTRGITLTTSSTSSTITGNTVRNITSASQGTGTTTSYPLTGIQMSSNSPSTVSGNTVHSLTLTTGSTTATNTVVGIYFASNGAFPVNLLTKNFVHSLDVTAVNTATIISGIEVTGGSNIIANNMVRLGITPAGTSQTTAFLIRGMFVNAGTTNENIYNNSIYIGGTGVGTTAKNTYAFLRGAATNGVHDIQNNIFVNNRSNSSTGGTHYAIAFTTNTSSATLNYNVYVATGTGGMFGNNGSTNFPTYSSGWVAGDIYSYTGDPNFIAPTGTSATVDLHIAASPATTSVEGVGNTVVGFTDDFDGQIRSGLTPVDIGADAGNFTSSLVACSTTTITAGAAVASSVGPCTATLSLTGNTTGVSGLTYQWQQRSPSGSGTFSNISGATSPSLLNTNLSGQTSDFQCVITCAGGGTYTSTPVSVTASLGFAAGFSPITLTSSSYTQKVIAHGNTGTTNPPLTTGGCTAAIDGSSAYCFYDASYSYNGSTYPATSLPVNGQIISSNSPYTGLLYQLQPAGTNQNTALQLRFGTLTTGTLTLATPTSGSTIYLLGVSGNGASNATCVVTFTDATTQTFSVTFPDWFNVTPYAQGGFGRVNASGFDATAPPTNPRMYDVPLALNPSNYAKSVASVTVTNTSAANNANNILNIFAMTMAVSNPSAFCGGLSTSITLFNPASSGVTYQWQASGIAAGPYSDVTSGTGATTTTYTNSATGSIYYEVQGTCTATGLKVNSNPVHININPAVTTSVTPSSSTYCSPGTGVTLTASSGTSGLTYNWSPTASLSPASGAVVVATPSSNTTYTVTASNPSTGCLGTASAIVNFANAPVITAISSTPTSLCLGGTSNLSVTATGATAYSWSPTASLTGASTATPVATPPAGITTYTVSVSNSGCTVTSSVSDTVLPLALTPTIIAIPGQAYTASGASSTQNDDILNVTFGSLNNTSACGTLATGPGSVASSYSNYTTSVAAPSITAGSATPYSVKVGYCNGTAYPTSFSVYIDLNNNGVFTEAGENVANVSNVTAALGGTVYAGTITIPTSAYNGVTRMRIVNTQGNINPVPSTGTYAFGETEDYNINITGATNPCGSTSFTLSTGQTGGKGPYTYNWNSTPVGFSSSSSSAIVNPTTNTTYTVTSTDACGSTVTASVSINVTNTTALTITPTSSLECGNAPAGISITSATSGYTYSWSPIAGLYTNAGGTTAYTTGANATTVYANPTLSTQYTVTATQTASGCSATQSANIYTVNTTQTYTNPTSCSPTSGIINITPLTGTVPTQVYQSNFSSGNAGIGTIGGTNAVITGGQLQLTADAGGQDGTLQIPQQYSPTSFHTEFYYTSASSAFTYADGISYSFGTNVAPLATANENGYGYGLKVCFDDYANGTTGGWQSSSYNYSGVYLVYGAPYTGPTGTGLVTYSSNISYQGLTHAKITIDVDITGKLTLVINGATVFNAVQLPAAWLTDVKTSWVHTFAARTGGSSASHIIDGVYITEGLTAFSPQYGYNNSHWQSSGTFTGLGAGTYIAQVRDSVNPSCIVSIGIDTLTVPALALTTSATTASSGSYCTAAYSSGTSASDYITNVTLGSINNTTGASASPYNTYYSSLSTNLTGGSTYTITGTINNGGTEDVAVWIDYNHDGTFSASEKLGEAAGLTFSIPFTIPTSALNGITRMRVRNVFSTTGIDPCSSYTYGEVEDYNVNISGGASANCGGFTSFQLAAIATGGANSYTYSWVSHPAGFTSTSANPTVSPLVTTTYIATVLDSCGNSRTDSTTAVVLPAPTVSVTPTAVNYCSGAAPDTLSASGGVSYTWSPAAGLISTAGASVYASPTVSTTYTVTGTSANGCYNTASAVVSVKTPPILSAPTASINPVCAGSPTVLNVVASRPPVSYCVPANTSSTHNIANLVISDSLTSTTRVSQVSSPTVSPFYQDYGTATGGTGAFTAGATYHLTGIDGNNSGNQFGGEGIWIDLNQDGVFDNNEFLGGQANSAGAGGTPAYGFNNYFVLPSTAYTGTTKLRVRSDWARSRSNVTTMPWSCAPGNTDGSFYGVTEDYTITISGGVNPPSSAFGYTWAPAATLSSATIASPTATPTASTIYNVVVKDSLNGCTSTKNDTVNTTARPTANISGPLTLCAGVSGTYNVVFTGTGPWNYAIDTVGGTITGVTTGNTIFFTVRPAATKTVKVTALSDALCTSQYADRDSQIIFVSASCAVTWVGVADTSWHNPNNWNPIVVPNSCSVDVTIPAGAPNYPTISQRDIQVGNITNGNNIRIKLNGHNLSVCKNFNGPSSAGTAYNITGSGKLILNGSTAQTLGGYGNVDELTVNNTSGGVSLTNLAYNHVSLYRGLNLQSGNINVSTSAFIILLSSNADTAAWLNDFASGYTGTFTGKLTAQRKVATTATTWQHQISSPVSGSGVTFYSLGQSTYGWHAAAPLIPSSNCSDDSINWTSPYSTALSWHESNVNATTPVCATKGWYTVGGPDVFGIGTGYSVYLTSASKISLAGTPGTGNINISGLTNSNWSVTSPEGHLSNSGWSLLGNPYPSSLDMSASRLGNGFDNQIHVFHPTGSYKGTYQPYTLGTPTAPVQISSFQAFMVHKTATGGTSSFPFLQSERTINQGANYHFYKTGADNQLAVNVSGNGFNDVTRVAFENGATDGFDPEFDANKFASQHGQPTLYTLASNSNLWMGINVLASFEKSAVVPMGFEAGADGSYTFSITAEDIASFDQSVSIYLEDKQNPANWINLRSSNSYTFTARATDSKERFALHFEKTNTAITEVANTAGLNIFSVENKVLVDFTKLKNVDATIQIYNILGQELSNETHHASSTYIKAIDNVEAAYVIVKVKLADGSMTGKKLFITK